jgi:enoyl-CoA hydratase
MSMVETKQDGDVTVITLSNPPMNVICGQLLGELATALDVVATDNSKVVVLTGAGRAFVAGADISEMKDMSPEEAAAFSRKGQAVFDKMEALKKPVIAAVNGFALGGGTEIAMACDIRVASEAASFGQPEVNLAVIPGFGGTQRLPRLVGAGKAMELILTGDIIKAKEALRIGLAQQLVDGFKKNESGELLKNEKGRPIPDNGPVLAAAIAMGKKIASKGPEAVQLAKESINRGMATDFHAGQSIEADLFGKCFLTPNQKEGMGAFLEKRKPAFK